jgi:hypothetical protein
MENIKQPEASVNDETSKKHNRNTDITVHNKQV